MSRKERRAAQRSSSATPSDADTDALFAAAVEHDRAGEVETALRLCRAVAARDPRHVPSRVLIGSAAQQAGRHRAAIRILREALDIDDGDATVHDAIAMAYQALGQRAEAERHFTRAIVCGLGNVEQFVKQAPAVAAGLDRLRNAWPRRLKLDELLGADGLGGIASAAMLMSLLRSRPVCDIELERLLTALRFALLQCASAAAPPDIDGTALALCCALAQQCFINEYVFAVSEAELHTATLLREQVVERLMAGAEATPFEVTVVGSYFPLHALPVALADRDWPAAMHCLIIAQVREPQDEARDRNAIAALTPVADQVSLAVQRQYEENPFPRWTNLPLAKPTTMAAYLRRALPHPPVLPFDEAGGFDFLVAGCGTGQHSIDRALRFPHARMLAVDLSGASLAYARRKTREAGLANIEYAKADILALGSVGRSFDVIESVGVLHHLAEPAAGWQVLLSLLRPGGLMAVGLYSALARRHYTALRGAIAARGFGADAAAIRACRQDIISRDEAPAATDFYTMSGCRDLLFNVMEHQFGIDQIKAFLDQNRLAFLGFEQSEETMRQFRQLHPDPAAAVDLDCWRAFEVSHPRTFSAMYVFWVQKAGA